MREIASHWVKSFRNCFVAEIIRNGRCQAKNILLFSNSYRNLGMPKFYFRQTATKKKPNIL
jgi:hypothetical protein